MFISNRCHKLSPKTEKSSVMSQIIQIWILWLTPMQQHIQFCPQTIMANSLSYLTTTIDLQILSYPSLQMLSSLCSYCVSQTPVLRLSHTTLHLFSSTYQLFFLLRISLSIHTAKHVIDQLFPGTYQYLNSSHRQPVFPIFPIHGTTLLTSPRISCTIYISKSQHSPMLFPLSS